MTSKKVTYFNDLMDAPYDVQLIEETGRKVGHVSIADRNGRGMSAVLMAPHQAERYKIRSCAEWTNNRLKEGLGANNVLLKGYTKVPFVWCSALSSCLPTNYFDWQPGGLSKFSGNGLYPTCYVAHCYKRVISPTFSRVSPSVILINHSMSEK